MGAGFHGVIGPAYDGGALPQSQTAIRAKKLHFEPAGALCSDEEIQTDCEEVVGVRLYTTMQLRPCFNSSDASGTRLGCAMSGDRVELDALVGTRCWNNKVSIVDKLNTNSNNVTC
jgi:hypothetical protein